MTPAGSSAQGLKVRSPRAVDEVDTALAIETCKRARCRSNATSGSGKSLRVLHWEIVYKKAIIIEAGTKKEVLASSKPEVYGLAFQEPGFGRVAAKDHQEYHLGMSEQEPSVANPLIIHRNVGPSR